MGINGKKKPKTNRRRGGKEKRNPKDDYAPSRVEKNGSAKCGNGEGADISRL